MKILSTISLLLISFAIQSQIAAGGRDFLTGLLTVIKGKDFKLDDACLGPEFEKDFSNLIDAIKTKNPALIIRFISKISNEIHQYCPISDIDQIQKDTVALGVKELTKRLLEHKIEVIEMLKKEFIIGKIRALTVGEAFGHIINLVVYEQPETALSFLGEQLNEIPIFSSVEKFVEGLFEGVSSGPVEENICLKNVDVLKEEITLVLSDIITGLNNKDYYKVWTSLLKLQDILSKLENIYPSCNFDQLKESLVALKTESGLTKLGWSIATHLSLVKKDITQFDSSISNQNFELSGEAIGDLLKVLLHYSTN